MDTGGGTGWRLAWTRLRRHLPGGQSEMVTAAAPVRLWDPVTHAAVGPPLSGHRGPINAIAAVELPGETLLASASDDCTIRLWTVPGGERVGELTGHTARVTGLVAVALPGGSSRLVSAAWDRTVRIWDPAVAAAVAVINLDFTAFPVFAQDARVFVAADQGMFALDLT